MCIHVIVKITIYLLTHFGNPQKTISSMTSMVLHGIAYRIMYLQLPAHVVFKCGRGGWVQAQLVGSCYFIRLSVLKMCDIALRYRS